MRPGKQFDQLDASLLLCPRCRVAQPVRKRLLLCLPEGDKYERLTVGLNLVGLRRCGMTAEEINQLKAAYRLIYRSGLRWTEILEQLARDFTTGPAALFHAFFSGGKRGFTPERRLPRTFKLTDDAAAADTADVELRVKAG